MTNSMTPTAKPVTIDGKNYVLRFNFGTMSAAEKELGENPLTVFADQGDGNFRISFAAVGSLFWAVLQPEHPMSRAKSDELIDAAGFQSVGQWIAEGMNAYFIGGGQHKSGDVGKARKKPARTPR